MWFYRRCVGGEMCKGKNILSLLKIRSEEYGERIALEIRNKYGWSEFSYKGIAHLWRF